MKKWPKNPNETVRFDELVTPLRKAVKYAYKLTRINVKKDIPWTGYEHGDYIGTTNPDPEEMLNRRWQSHEREQGRSPIDTILAIAVQLGIEQGMRLERQRGGPRVSLVELLEHCNNKKESRLMMELFYTTLDKRSKDEG